MSLNRYIDATILKPEAKEEEFIALCESAISYEFPAICIPPFMIGKCKKFLGNSSVKVATVIGFPAGYQTVQTKMFELRDAINLGADEIDYVVHRGYLAENDWETVEKETNTWIDICKQNNVISKWIIESSALSSEQIWKLLEIANKCKPNYVKTSTGVYGKAKLEDVRLFRQILSSDIKIKAAGGISTRAIAEDMVNVGADRLGVSQYLSLLQ